MILPCPPRLLPGTAGLSEPRCLTPYWGVLLAMSLGVTAYSVLLGLRRKAAMKAPGRKCGTVLLGQGREAVAVAPGRRCGAVLHGWRQEVEAEMRDQAEHVVAVVGELLGQCWRMNAGKEGMRRRGWGAGRRCDPDENDMVPKP